VGSNYSVMITVVDANLQMGGIVSRTDSTAMLEGDFTLMQEGRLKMTYLPENTELLTGDLVLTSGLTGIYPSGLVVGAIESLHTGHEPVCCARPRRRPGPSGGGLYHQGV